MSNIGEKHAAGYFLTGYQLWPRGFFEFDWESGNTSILFQRPVTGHGHRVIFRNGKYLLDAYTPSNGAVIDREGGWEESDSELIIHVLDTDGNLTFDPIYPESEQTKGQIVPFVIEFKEGEEDVYFATHKSSSYHPGVPKIFRFDEQNGVLDQIYSGPENDRPYIMKAAMYKGERVLLLGWRESKRFDVLDSDFSPLFSFFSPGEESYFRHCIFDFDGDGTSELFFTDKQKGYIYSLSGSVLWEIAGKDGDGNSVGVTPFVTDVDLDGKGDVIIAAGDTITIYSY